MPQAKSTSDLNRLWVPSTIASFARYWMPSLLWITIVNRTVYGRSSMDFMICTLPPKSPKIFARRFLAQIGIWEGETSVLLGEDLGYATWGISICPTHQKNDVAFFFTINAGSLLYLCASCVPLYLDSLPMTMKTIGSLLDKPSWWSVEWWDGY